MYAFVGETGARTPANEGLDVNLGPALTPTGVLPIDSAAARQGARQIHEAPRRVTARLLRWVIDTGGQDHRGPGNSCLRAPGAEPIARAAAGADQRDRGNDRLRALRAELGPKADGTVPVLQTRWLQGCDERLDLGSVVVELRRRAGAHTPATCW